jgi:SAM-dependent methyltransferase
MQTAGELGADGLAPTTRQFGTTLGDVARCETCGHMQLDPMPDEAVLEHAYAVAESDDYVGEEAGQRATAKRALALLETHAQRPGALLDLGCWVGFLLAEARDRGWDTLGVEPSRFAAEYARKRLALNVVTGELLSTPLPERSFSAVTMGDVIEHLPDPGAALGRIHDLLEPGGLLWLALPDSGSLLARALGRRWWSVLPTHVQYFTRDSLRLLLARHGFTVLDLKTAPKVFSVAYYLERIGGYSDAAGTLLRRTADRLSLDERLWAPDFRDRMQVVARAVL